MSSAAAPVELKGVMQIGRRRLQLGRSRVRRRRRPPPPQAGAGDIHSLLSQEAGPYAAPPGPYVLSPAAYSTPVSAPAAAVSRHGQRPPHAQRNACKVFSIG